MACDISKGRAINCKDQIGGLKAAWIMGFGNLGTVTLGSNDEATDASGTGTFFQYDLKGSAILWRQQRMCQETMALRFSPLFCLYLSQN